MSAAHRPADFNPSWSSDVSTLLQHFIQEAQDDQEDPTLPSMAQEAIDLEDSQETNPNSSDKSKPPGSYPLSAPPGGFRFNCLNNRS